MHLAPDALKPQFLTRHHSWLSHISSLTLNFEYFHVFSDTSSIVQSDSSAKKQCSSCFKEFVTPFNGASKFQILAAQQTEMMLESGSVPLTTHQNPAAIRYRESKPFTFLAPWMIWMGWMGVKTMGGWIVHGLKHFQLTNLLHFQIFHLDSNILSTINHLNSSHTQIWHLLLLNTGLPLTLLAISYKNVSWCTFQPSTNHGFSPRLIRRNKRKSLIKRSKRSNMGSTGSDVEVTLRRSELMLGGGKVVTFHCSPWFFSTTTLVFIDVKHRIFI